MRIQLFTGCIGLLLLAGCKKKDIVESQGTNFNLLLKTVTKNHPSGETEILYRYDNLQRVTQTYLRSSGAPGSGSRSPETETFYRNPAGRLDSAITTANVNNVSVFSQGIMYRYNGSGQIINTISRFAAIKDSSVYTYSGNLLQQRTDYRSNAGNPYIPFMEVRFSFDASGNPTTISYLWLTAPGNTSYTISYDNRVNPLPIDRYFAGYWTPAFYTDFKYVNNPVSLTASPGGSNSFRDEYTYSANNKPLYRKRTTLTTPTTTEETWFYYD
jgi:hypothetical protein